MAKVKAGYVHADSCTAQNKNTTSIQCLMRHVMTSKNESIELSFMLAGPTKLSPDRLFDKVQVENGLHCPEEHTFGGGAVL